MDMTVLLCPLTFSLRATIDHHGPSIHADHYTVSINCCKKKYIATTAQLRNLKLFIAKLLYCICYTLWIDWLMSFGLEQEGEILITPMAHPLHPINSRSRKKRRNQWVGRCASSWWLLSHPQNLCNYIYLSIRIHSLCELFYRTYICIHKECRSVLMRLPPITVYRTGFGECAVPVLNATFCFLWFTNQLCLAQW